MAVDTNSLTCGFNWQCTADAIGYAVMITARRDSLPSPQSLPQFGSTPAGRQPGCIILYWYGSGHMQVLVQYTYSSESVVLTEVVPTEKKIRKNTFLYYL